MSALDRWLFARIDASLYGLLRLFFGISGVCKFTGMTSPLPRLVQGGFDLGLPVHRYRAVNFPPGVLAGDWLPAPTHAQYCAVEVAALVLAVCVAAGVASRVAAFCFAAACGWLLLVDPAGFKHNLFALCCFGFLLSACPCGDRFSVDAAVRRRLGRSSPPARLVFPLRLVQVQLAVVYLFSVLVKLGDGWSTGHLLFAGVPKTVQRLHAAGLDVVVPLVEFRGLYAATAWVTVAVEAFLVVGFFFARTRAWALFLGVCLHSAIDLGLDVGSYSLTVFAIYVAFIEPVPRQTKVTASKKTARLFCALDWLCRLDVVVDDARAAGADGGFVVESGSGAPREVWWRLPLTFPFAFAVDQGTALWTRLRRR